MNAEIPRSNEARVETIRGGIHLTTPHPPADYADVRCVDVAPGWTFFVVVPNDGEPFRALGGERLLPYRTPGGGQAQGFELRTGDRVTRVRTGLPFQFAEWRIERA